MPGRLETLLTAHRADLFAAWEARILESRPSGPAPSHEAVRATVREAYADLLLALHAGAPRPHASAPRVLALTAVDAGGGRTTAPASVPVVDPAPADALIALVAGREVIKECAARELAPHEASECLPELADAFRRALVARAPQG